MRYQETREGRQLSKQLNLNSEITDISSINLTRPVRSDLQPAYQFKDKSYIINTTDCRRRDKSTEISFSLIDKLETSSPLWSDSIIATTNTKCPVNS